MDGTVPFSWVAFYFSSLEFRVLRPSLLKKTHHLENCKGFILNYSVGEPEPSYSLLFILVSILRIGGGSWPITARVCGLCTAVKWGGDRREMEGPWAHPCPFTGSSDGVALWAQTCLDVLYWRERANEEMTL